MKTILTKLVFPEDKIEVYYDKIEIKEIYNDKAKALYEEILQDMTAKYSTYRSASGANTDSFSEWYRKNLDREDFAIHMNKLIENSNSYLDNADQVKLSKEIMWLITDLLSLGAGRLIKSINNPATKELLKGILDGFGLIKTTKERN